jgi:hypothetical protein
MGWGIVKDTYHANVVRTSMTRNLSVLFPEIRDEIVVAFDDVLPTQGKGIFGYDCYHYLHNETGLQSG